MTLIILRTGRVFHSVPQWGFVWYISQDWTGLWVWRRMTREEKCHSHHFISRAPTITMLRRCWCWPWTPGWASVCLSASSNAKLLFFSFCSFLIVLWKEVTGASPHVRTRTLRSSSSRAKHLHKLSEILLQGKYSLLSCLFIYSIIDLHQYGLRVLCFILCVVIQHYFIYLEEQSVPCWPLWEHYHLAAMSLRYTPTQAGCFVLFVWWVGLLECS